MPPKNFGHQNIPLKLLALVFFSLSFLAISSLISNPVKADEIGINRLNPATLQKVDQAVNLELNQAQYLIIGLVDNGEVVFTKSYGNIGVDDRHYYHSVTKPLTATLVMQLIREGKINSVNDSIWLYLSKINGQTCVQDKWKENPVTIKQILTHTSGLPHYEASVCPDGKLNLQFEPGSQYKYSSKAFGILGEILTKVTGKSYHTLVKERLASPANAPSLQAKEQSQEWLSPAGWASSNIKDLALFSVGVIKNTFIPPEILYDQMLQRYINNRGLGWQCDNPDTQEVTAYHGGTWETSRSYLMIKPKQKLAVALFGQRKSTTSSNYSLSGLARSLMAIVENETLPSPTPTSSFNPYDLNADGQTNPLDIREFLSQWLSQSSKADFNQDGKVNAYDFAQFLISKESNLGS